MASRGSHFRRKPATREAGYILLVLGLFVTLLAFAVISTAPRIVQQLKREREEEMIHRGSEYARAIRKFVRKTGTYPTSLDQLEETNRVRFLRKRYKDPLSPEGEWRPLRVTDVPFLTAVQNVPQLGQPASQLGQPGGASRQGQGGQQPSGQRPQGAGLLTGQIASPAGNQSSGGLVQGAQARPQPGTGSSSPTSGGPPGSTQGGRGPQGTQLFGAGAIVGVASASEAEGIREFNAKRKYKEWYFIYDAASEAVNPQGGGLIRGPYTGKTFAAGATGSIGTPAGQLASPRQPAGFSQPIGGAGASPSSLSAPPSRGR